MAGHGQFCSVARSLEILGGRWTLLVVRELICGSTRFSEIRRGIPRISPTLLSERLSALTEAGAIARLEGSQGPEYALTEAGKDLLPVIGALAMWGQRWLPRNADDEDIDLDALLHDMQRRADFERIPTGPFVIRLNVAGRKARFMLFSKTEVAVCTSNPGFPEPLVVKTPLSALVGWWRGDIQFSEAQRAGLAVDGPREMVREFPSWFHRYMFAEIPSAARSQQGAALSES